MSIYTNTVTVQVQDRQGATAQAVFTIPVNASPIIITNSSPLPNATQDSSYQNVVPLAATGGVAPYSFSLISVNGGPPANANNQWSVYSPSGPTGWTIEGVPGYAETDTLVIQCTDSTTPTPFTVQKTFSLTVTAVALTITTTSPLPNATISQPYSFAMSPGGGTPPYTWAITADSPDTGSWLSINASSGVLSGTPGTLETESLTIRVTDHLGTNYSANFSLTVAAASAIVPNFWIAPNGDDNNNGLTPATAWSITALNSKESTYAGKVIGIIGDVSGVQTPIQYGTVGGVQTTLYSLYQALPGTAQSTAVALAVNGGTSLASPTYLASFNSSGTLTPRWAIIDFAQPGTGTVPTTDGGGMGQNQYGPVGNVANYGNVTYDGLTLRNHVFGALVHYSPGNAAGLTIQNCEIYNGYAATSSDNPGMIWINGYNNPIIYNNKIHDGVTLSGGVSPGGLSAIIILNVSMPSTVTYNTTYNTGPGCYLKDHWQWGTIAYNYFDLGNFGSYGPGTLGSCVERSCPAAGQVLNVHHNVGTGGWSFYGASGNSYISGTVNCYNNTSYITTNCPNGQRNHLITQCTSSTVGTVNFYNNLNYVEGGTINDLTVDCYNDYGITSATGGMCDYNTYHGAQTYFGSYQAPPGLGPDSTLAQWQTAGHDTHSINLTSRPFVGGVIPTFKVVTSFALSGSSAAYTGGIVSPSNLTTGQIIGALNSSGAASDGSGRVGCNF